MDRFKYIAALEISSEEVRFAVSRMSFVNNSFMVVHKSRFQGQWFNGEKIINNEMIATLLKRSIYEFEGKFKTKLEFASLVIPDFSSRMQKAFEHLNFAEPKVITVADLETLKKNTRIKFSNDREMAIKMQANAVTIDGKPVVNIRNFQGVGRQIAASQFVTIIRREIFDDHAAILKECGLSIGQVRTTSMAHSEVLMRDSRSETAVILNWMNKKVVASIHINGVLVRVTEWRQGIDNIANAISKYASSLRPEFIKNYMFQTLEVNREYALDDKVILRRGKNENKVEMTSAELKMRILNHLNYMIQEIEKLIVNSGIDPTKMKIYHVGKISKIPRYEEILRNCSHYKDNLSFPKLDVFGANENWTQIIVGMMLLDVKKNYAQHEARMRAEKVAVQPQRNMQHQLQRQQIPQPMLRQQNYAQQQTYATPQMSMQMLQKTYTK